MRAKVMAAESSRSTTVLGWIPAKWTCAEIVPTWEWINTRFKIHFMCKWGSVKINFIKTRRKYLSLVVMFKMVLLLKPGRYLFMKRKALSIGAEETLLMRTVEFKDFLWISVQFSVWLTDVTVILPLLEPSLSCLFNFHMVSKCFVTVFWNVLSVCLIYLNQG